MIASSMNSAGIDKKKLVLWSLYDFANSIVMIVFFLYYSQWLVVDMGVSDLWFNMTFVGSSLLFLLTVPVAGSITDKIGVGMPGLRVTTVMAAAFYFTTGLIAAVFPAYYVLSVVAFTLGTYFYLFSFTYYHPMLAQVASSERQGLASGWGMFGDWTGQIFGLLVALPLASGFAPLGGLPGKAQTLMPATILFLLLALPMLTSFEEGAKPKAVKVSITSEYKDAIRSFLKLCALPGVGLFLLSYFFFNDAVTTASNNFPIYLDKLFGVGDAVQTYLLVAIVSASAIGGPLSGYLADRFGFKRTLMWILGGWIAIFPLMAVIRDLRLFIVVSIVMGLWFGSIWTVTRAYLMRLTPGHMLNQSFTYYTLMERLATFIGPISWSLAVAYLPTAGAFNYRSAAALMAVFVLIGLLIARKLPAPVPVNREP